MHWQDLDRKIDELASISGIGFLDSMTASPDARRIRALAAEIYEAFRTVKYPNADDRERAWQRYSTVRSQALAKLDSDREERRRKSHDFKQMVLRHVEAARPATLLGFDSPGAEEMKALGRVLRDARRAKNQHEDDMLSEHKAECSEAIQEVQEVHDHWWDQLRKTGTQKQAEWRARIRANLERNYERHRHQSEALARHRAQAEELAGKIANAWNDKWAADASRRLADLERRIASMEDHLREIERWIREDEERLA